MRTIHIKREPAFTGIGRKWEIYIDGTLATTIQSGDTVDIPVDNASHTVEIVFPLFVLKKLKTGPLKIRSGNNDCSLSTYIKNNFLGYTLVLEPSLLRKKGQK